MRSLLLGCSVVVLMLSCGGAAQAVGGVAVRAGHHAEFDRIVFEYPSAVNAVAEMTGQRLVIRFDTPMTGDPTEIIRRLSGEVSGMSFTADRRTFSFELRTPRRMQQWSQAGKVVVDLFRLQGDAVAEVLPAGKPQTAGSSFAGAASASPPTSQAMGKQVAQQRVIVLTVPIRLGELFLGDGGVRIGGGGEVTVSVDRLIAVLSDIAANDVLDALRQVQSDDGYAPLNSIAAAGVPISFDQSTVELRIDLEATQRRATTLGTQGGVVGPREATHQPAELSAYLNLRSVTDFVHESTTRPAGRGDTTLGLDGAAHWRGFTLEHQSTLTDAADPRFQRGRTRLLYDDLDDVIRYSAGDLSYGTVSYQGFVPAGGIAIERRYGDLQPYSNIRPTGRFEFILERPSRVNIYLNGQIFRTLNLQPGPYDLKDFQLGEGVNDITLEIEDDLGRIETRNFSAFFENTLLQAGISEFSYAVGAQSGVRSGQVRYDSEAVASFFHRYGLTDTLTVGANGQATGEAWMGGVTALWATSLGTFDFQAAVSDASGGTLATALSLDYQLRSRDEETGDLRQFDLSLDYLARDFGAVSTVNPFNTVEYEAAARYSQNLPLGLRGSVGGRYGFGQAGQDDRWAVNAFVSRTFFERLNVGFSLERFEDQNDPAETRAIVTFSLRFDDRNQSVRGRYDSLQNTQRLDYGYSTANRVGNFSGSVGLARSPDDHRFTGDLNYTGDRLEVSVDHDLLLDRPTNGFTEETTRVRLGTAVAFADGHVAVGRPISNSFAIVYPHESIAKSEIVVDPSVDGPRTRAGTFGPAVVPDLGSYVITPLPIAVSDLPLGYDLGTSERPFVQSAYRSGAVIQVGSGRNVSVLGTLVDALGAPLALVAGRVVPLDAGEGQPVDIFTNSAGRFVAQPLAPGRYAVTVSVERKSYTGTIDVPDGLTGLFRAGKVTAVEGAAPAAAPQGEGQ